MPRVAYDLLHPEHRTTSVVFASPHSGSDYPWTFLRKTVLDQYSIRSSEDAFVDELYSFAPKCGAPLLKAGAPRAFIDLNRASGELDPAVVEGVSAKGHNPRIASGLGVIPRVVAGGRAIYHGKLPLREAQRRIDMYWRPYHDILAKLLNQSSQVFGEAILIDCHSMPHEAMDLTARGASRRPEIVIGDRHGASADSQIVDRIEEAFVAAGFVTVRNVPFAGAYICQTYGRPARGHHAIQIEIDRSLYMNEKMIRPNGNFDTVRRRLKQVITEIAEIGRRKEPLAAQ
ncbi:N-formylglutamate amidohydrolase [Rhodobacteraceae bacterium 63075]|nr:N-formylglutamate amidohydrolase [Rhodobacteraceae bacterium 63075]